MSEEALGTSATVIEPFGVLRSRLVVIAEDDIDTDQIFPARFMATTVRTGLGEKLFYDWRHDSEGEPIRDHVLNQIDRSSHRILVTGRNFGSGSSREHAPWALVDFGFRAVVAPSFADIFKTNALQNGLLPIAIAPEDFAAVTPAAGEEMVIDLEKAIFQVPSLGLERTFAIDPFGRRCLLDGSDSLGWLVRQLPAIIAFEAGAAQR